MADLASDDMTNPALARIERAVARIERASAARVAASAALTRRHQLLRARMTDALDALDTLIAAQEARGTEDA
ncbi:MULTISPECIES: hypothetical protein [unclassified Sphingomonas]|jgi:hypothetical protein|uniref:hypothetical protein n=1 Tax=unclassified Sphingomonas TaxID=196159 RepID=UPI0008330B76|nr:MULTISPECIES: hypothetical protein [unclassified Sphingomonas]